MKQSTVIFACAAFVFAGCNGSATNSDDNWGKPTTVEGFWRTVKVNHYRPNSDTMFMQAGYGNTVKEINKFSGSAATINTISESNDCYTQIDLTLAFGNGIITLGKPIGDSINYTSTNAYFKNDTLKMRWYANEDINRDMEVFMVKYDDNLPFPICAK